MEFEINLLWVVAIICIIIGWVYKLSINKATGYDELEFTNRNLQKQLDEAWNIAHRIAKERDLFKAELHRNIREREEGGKYKRLLDEANATIRKANARITELKSGKSNQSLPSMNDYTILGANSDTSKAELKKKYKVLSSVYHPDKAGNGVMMQRINDAYARLK